MSNTIDKQFAKVLQKFENFTKETISDLLYPITGKKNWGPQEKDPQRWKYAVLGPLVDLLNQNIRTYQSVFEYVKTLTWEREKQIGDELPENLSNPKSVKNSSKQKKSSKKIDSLTPIQLLENTQLVLNELKSEVETKISPLNIDFNQVMNRIEKVQFPENSNQQVYIGTFDSKGLKSGKGSLADGYLLYNGCWFEDKRNGYGIQVYEDGIIFEGDWEENKPQVGKWTFTDQSQFYGKYHKLSKIQKKKTDKKEWMIGLKDLTEVEKVLGAKAGNVKNVFYFDGRATALKNIVMDQEIDIEGLMGEKEPHKIVTIQYMNKVKYEGMWSDFKPNLFGKFIFPDGEEVKVLTRTGKTVPYSSCNPPNIDEILDVNFLKIEFLDGTTYEGNVNDNLEFYGFGELITKKFKVEEDKKNGIFFEKFSPLDALKAIKEVDGENSIDGMFDQLGEAEIDSDGDVDDSIVFRGLFNSKEGLTVQFTQEDVEVLKTVGTDYFIDSNRYKKEKKDIPELELHIWYPVHDDDGEIEKHVKTKYIGGWKNFKIYGKGYMAFDDPSIEDKELHEGEAKDGVFFVVKDVDFYSMQRMTKDDFEKNKVDYEFFDGKIYKGTYDAENYCFKGIGELYIPKEGGGFRIKEKDNKEYEKKAGYWEDNKLIFDKSLLVKGFNFVMSDIRNGDFRVEYKNGIIYDGTWEECRWFEDESSMIYRGKDDKEGETWDPSKTYLDKPEEPYEYNGRLFAFNLRTIKNKKMSDIYKTLIMEESIEQKLMIEYNFLENESAILQEIPKVTKSNQIGNGFEIFEMKLSPADSSQEEHMLQNNELPLDSHFIYNERKIATKLQNISDDDNFEQHFKDMEDKAYFQNEKYVKKLKYFDIEELVNHPRKAYVQISKTGLLRTTVDLFRLFAKEEQFQSLNLLRYNPKFLYAMYELNKINGIKRVGYDYIEFFNGDVYLFKNIERSNEYSLGSYYKYEEELAFESRGRHYYWSRFLNRTRLTQFHDRYFKKYIEDFFCFTNLGKTHELTMGYSGSKIFKVSWLYGRTFGNGTLYIPTPGRKKEREEKGFWFNNQRYQKEETNQYRLADYRSTTLRSLVDEHKLSSDIFNLFTYIPSYETLTADNQLNDKFQFDANPIKHTIEQRFSVEIDNSPNTNIEEILSNIKGDENSEDKEHNDLMNVKISYPNGDYFEGKKDLNWKTMGRGEYRWHDGYTYKGEFFLSSPFGYGEYSDCLGVKRESYFFRGYPISNPHGLDKLVEYLKKDENFLREKYGKTLSTLEADDLELISDPELMKGCGLFKQFKVRYGLLYKDIMIAKDTMIEDLQNIKDGELDYKYNWSNKMRINIRQDMLMIEKEKKENEEEENTKVDWISDLDPNKLKDFEKQLIFELVRDKDEENFKKIYRKFRGKKLLYKLITSKDFHKKNMLMVAAELGHIQIFLDLLCCLEATEEFNQEKLLNLLKEKDFEGNNIIDLTCIRGYNIDDEDIFTVKVDNKFKQEVKVRDLDEELKEANKADEKEEGNDKNKDKNIIKGKTNKITAKQSAKDLSSKIKIKDENKKFVKNNPRKTGENFNKKSEEWVNQERYIDKKIPKVFHDILETLSSNEILPFTKDYINFKTLKEMADYSNSSLNSSDICFVSRRSAILFTLIKFMESHGISVKHILEIKQYNGKINNPLHFSLYHGDLHCSLMLLRHRSDLMFCRNHEKELPAQVIKYAGKHQYKAKAVFASILDEFTRDFNFQIIYGLLLDDLKEMKEAEFNNERDIKLKGFLKKVKKEIEKDDNYKKQLEKLNRKNKDKKLDKKSNDKKKADGRIKKTKDQIHEMKKVLNRNFFNYEKIFLYKNNYVLLSDELCKAYIKHLQEKSRYKHLKRQQRVMKNYVFIETSPLEALQRNFLDFFKPGTSDSKLKKYPVVRRQVQEILMWYVYIFGDAAIEPETYERLQIEPYALILDGRNIFHFMCENNSYSLLIKFLNFLFDKCHFTSYDGTRETYAEWHNRTIMEDRFNAFRRNLNTVTKDHHDTPAHICIFNKSIECLETLLAYNINIDVMNLRGRSIRELLSSLAPYNLESEMTLKPDDISLKIKDSVKQDIFATCKQHSLTFEFIKNAKNSGIQKIINNSIYQLDDDLTKVRNKVLERIRSHNEEFQNAKIELKEAFEFLNEMKEIEELNKEDKKKKVKEIRAAYLKNIPYKNFRVEMNYNLLTALDGNEFEFIEFTDIVKKLFEIKFLKKFKNFKYMRQEKLIKSKMLTAVERDSFAVTVNPDLKYRFGMDQLLCIEILTGLDETLKGVQENIVLNQIKNIREKYMKYGGGLRIDLIKGYEHKIRKWYFFCPQIRRKWYVLITPTEKLLTKIATDLQMETYNMKDKYHTVYSVNSINKSDLEPLRHFQKVEIMMKLIKEEFDIDSYIKKNLMTQYYPIHNYQERRAIRKMWSNNKWIIHWKDISHIFKGATNKMTLKLMSLITFYHGIQQGFYFGFLALYTNFMVILGIFGLFAFLIQFILSKIYDELYAQEVMIFLAPFFVGTWSTLFTNFWKSRETELAYSFDVLKENTVKEVMSTYKGKSVIDEGSFNISKKYTRRYLFSLIVTTLIFLFAAIFVGGTYFLTLFFNNMIEDKNPEDSLMKTVLNSSVGIGNGILNFAISWLYNKIVDYVVEKENHAYDNEMRKSIILKKVTFKIFSSVFTLCAQSIVEDRKYSFYSSQILSNLVTSAILNYGLSVGVPVFSYMSSRYSFGKAICCCCGKKRGKLEKEKEELIKEMLSDPNTGPAFDRYCTLPYKYFKNLVLKKEAGARKFQKKLKEKKELKKIEEEKEVRLRKLKDSMLFGSVIKNFVGKKKEAEEKKKKKEEEEKKKKEEEKPKVIYESEEDEVPDKPKDKGKEDKEESLKLEDVKDDDVVHLSDDSDNEIEIGESDEDDESSDDEEDEEKKKLALEKKKKEAEELLKYQLNFKESPLRDIEVIPKDEDYKGNAAMLGEERPKNIMLRLKEEFALHILGREKIIETSMMIDLGSLEDDLQTSNLTQFAFNCFFTPYLIYAGTVSLIVNIFVIILTVKIYTEVTRRPISRREKSIGIWNDLYSIVGYLGVLYNAAVLVRKSRTVSDFFGYDKDSERDKDVLMAYNMITCLLAFKYVLARVIPKLPSWISARIIREKLIVERIKRRNDMTLNRLGRNENGEIDEKLFEDKESQSLRYFFDNNKQIAKFEKLKVNKSELREEDEDKVDVNQFEPNIKIDSVR